jgi:hypothetical protein
MQSAANTRFISISVRHEQARKPCSGERTAPRESSRKPDDIQERMKLPASRVAGLRAAGISGANAHAAAGDR